MQEEDFLLQQFPVRGVGAAPLAAMTHPVEYVVASNGLWRRLENEWLKSLCPLAVTRNLFMPFGTLVELHDLLVPCPPKPVWAAFLADARAVFPMEAAGLFVWNPETSSWRYAPRPARFASHAHIEYTEPELQDGELAIVDIHSHGQYPAFFSDKDNLDDRGSLKLAVCIGNVDQPQISLQARAVLIDQHRPLHIIPNQGWQIGTSP